MSGKNESVFLRDDGHKITRANRHFVSGYAWHLTHRCHKREFHLKFAMEKQQWMYWLFEAKSASGFALWILQFAGELDWRTI